MLKVNNPPSLRAFCQSCSFDVNAFGVSTDGATSAADVSSGRGTAILFRIVVGRIDFARGLPTFVDDLTALVHRWRLANGAEQLHERTCWSSKARHKTATYGSLTIVVDFMMMSQANGVWWYVHTVSMVNGDIRMCYDDVAVV